MRWRVVASACLLSAGVIPALGADLPARPVAKSERSEVALYNWNGFYIGANAGYSLGSASTNFAGTASTAATPNGTVFDNRPRGGTYGGQAGYNWHTSGLLMGIEADFQGTSEEDTVTCSVTCAPAASLRTRFPWFSTARARFGWAPDRWMAYFTFGAAYASIAWTANQAGVYAVESRMSRFGWTAGAGAEYGLTDNISAKVEYLYMDFSSVTKTLPSLASGTAGAFILNPRWYDHIVRAGLNFRFAAAPVIVRY